MLIALNDESSLSPSPMYVGIELLGQLKSESDVVKQQHGLQISPHLL